MPPDPLPRQLADLADLLGGMCDAAATALARATVALLDGHERLAQQVVAGDALLDDQRARVEEIASDALLFHAPVAGDLRSHLRTGIELRTRELNDEYVYTITS